MAKMSEIKKINIISLTKVYTILMAITGFLRGIVELIANKITPTVIADPMNIIYYTLLYAVAGIIAAAIGALLYNYVAKYVGGIKIELGK